MPVLSAVPCRYYISRHSLHSLKDVGLLRFRGGPICWLEVSGSEAAVMPGVTQTVHPHLAPLPPASHHGAGSC